MAKDNSFIHLFETPGGFYLYDVNRNSILKVEKSVYDSLKASKDIISDDNVSDEASSKNFIKNMKEKGFLSEKRINEISHPATDKLDYFLSNKIRMIILQVTQQCNLRCEYCAYSGKYMNRGHANNRMSFETAKKGIDFLIANSRDVDSINIGFYGGEPLLEFKLMKKCIEYAETAAEGKNVTFNFTTNGTLFTKEIIEYLWLHDVSIMISLDGPREVQDKSRRFASNGCGTFDKISENLEMFKTNYPEYFKRVMFNSVLDKESDFGCINDFFASYDTIKDSFLNAAEQSGSYSKSNIKSSEEFDIKMRYETFKLYLSKINKLDSKNVSKLVQGNFRSIEKIAINEREHTIELPDKAHHSGPCIPGIQRLFIDVNGNLYPCEKCSESSDTVHIGHIDKGFNIEKVRKLLNIGKVTSENCVNCWAFRFCSICAVVVDDTKGISPENKRLVCGVVKRVQEQYLKDYCALNEFGYKFDDESRDFLMEG